MSKYFALIKNRLVQGIIVADDVFRDTIKNDYDVILDVTNVARPAVGDSYYPATEEFVSNLATEVNIPVDHSLDYLNEGTADGFETFATSKYTVQYQDGFITIGCKKYSAPGVLVALHEFLNEDPEVSGCFTIESGNPAHGKYEITWEDAQMIYDALKKVRFQ